MPKGYWENTWNKAVSEEAAMAVSSSAVKFPATFSPMLPNTENQRTDTSVGTMMTPRINSRMVRPREIRAMKMPTKGVQESHQAQ